jgi:hypothetical protein
VWEVTQVTVEALSSMNPIAGIAGAEGSDLLYVGYVPGGISMQRCPDHCWDSDQWYGGFVGRSAQFGALLWDDANYRPTGAFGAFDSGGSLFASYRFVSTGEVPDAPKTLRVNDGASLNLNLAP